jgi:hypothetical protein
MPTEYSISTRGQELSKGAEEPDNARGLDLEFGDSTQMMENTTNSSSATPSTNIIDHSMASSVDESTK